MISERLTDFTLKDVLFFKASTKLTWFKVSKEWGMQNFEQIEMIHNLS